MNVTRTTLPALLATALLSPCFAEELTAVLGRTGIPTGLVVVLGDSESRDAEQLARTGRYLVHQFVPADRVESLRRKALESGVSGRVVIDALPHDGRLPHPDRFVDLVVTRTLDESLPEAELHRVLNVGGRILVHNGAETKWTDRRPETGIDSWTHKWHGPSGQVLSHDEKAGPPTSIQWVAGPAFADGSIGGKHPVIGRGTFVAVDNVDGAVQVRSAGNGLSRWRGEFALSPTAELLLDGDRLLCRPQAAPVRKGSGEHGPLVAFDLVSGTQRLVFADAPQTTLVPGGRKAAFPATIALADRLVTAADNDLAVVERESGRRIWTKKLEAGSWFSPIVLDEKLIVAECQPDSPATRARIDNGPGAVAVLAFALADGKPRWRFELDRQAPPLLPLVAAEGTVFLHTSSYQSRHPGAYLAAIDLRTGQQLWRQNLLEGTKEKWSATDSASRVICRAGTLYYIGGHTLGAVAAFDARTGKVVHAAERRPKFVGYGGECSGSLATVNWLIMSGTAWWDRDFRVVSQPAARSACGTGVFPAQGMVFANPTGCDCTQYTRGYLGLGCTPLPSPAPEEKRLLSGPGKAAADEPNDWPTLLANPQRTGVTPQSLPAKLVELWRTRAAPEAIAGPLLDDRRRDEYWNGALTAPVATGKTVVVGLSDAHGVAAIEADSGRVRWRVPLGGPIDTPPTLYRGLCLVGCQDGWLYALSLDDGRLVWKFFAAPSVRTAVLHGRLASAFPVPGSVLVVRDRLLAAAGHHSYLGGIHVWVLDPLTGQRLTPAASIANEEPPTQGNVVFNDVLCAGKAGEDAWIFRHCRLNLDGQRIDVPKRNSGEHYPGDVATFVHFDRRAPIVRFPHNLRGGSTHGWKAKSTSGPVSAYRVVRDGPIAYALDDPTDDVRVYNKEVILRAQRADAVRFDDRTEPLWTKKPAELKQRESYTSLIKAGDRLYLGGGNRDGSAGFVQVVAAADGSLIEEHSLPALVAPCGLAAANGRLLVSCVDGQVVALGTMQTRGDSP